jgi:hypothetical protein
MKVLEVIQLVIELRMKIRVLEKEDGEHRKNEVEQEKKQEDVHEAGEGEYQGLDDPIESLELFRLHQLEKA